MKSPPLYLYPPGTKYFCIVVFTLLISYKCFGQEKNTVKPAWDSLAKIYHNGKLNDTSYLAKAIQLASSKGNYAATKNELELFREIAFSKNTAKYIGYRAKYFQFLANDAMYNNNDGSSIFYCEKMESEYKKLHDYIPTFTSYRLSIGWFIQWKEPRKGLEKIKEIQPFINDLSQLILTKRVPYVTIANVQYILKFAQEFHQQLNDTAAALQMLETARKNYAAMLKRTDQYSKDYTLSLLNDLHYMEYTWELYKKNYTAAENIMRLLYNESIQADALHYDWAKGMTLSYTLYMADFFIQTHQPDSASRYMDIYKQRNNPPVSQVVIDERALSIYSKLEKSNGNYLKAFNYLEQAYLLKDSISNARMSDISNNLYAQAEADYNRTELDNLEKQKKRRNTWIILLITTMAGSVAILYNWFKRRERKSKKDIEQINITSRLHIAELEDRNRLSKKEEQQRLGIELHDNLASTLAAIKLKLEVEAEEAKNTALGDRLSTIKTLVVTAYENTREKSHEWYNQAYAETTDSTFEEMIHIMLDKGLLVDRYEKEIFIDNDALSFVSLNQKIELLYIIQEAVINILKHAKATKISIMIYEDILGVVVSVKDNGLGFDSRKKKNGIGLSSLAERVKRIDGVLHIESGDDGTEISVTINQ